jgi:hypothetical protein
VSEDEHESVVEVFPENFPDWALSREQRERYGRDRPVDEDAPLAREGASPDTLGPVDGEAPRPHHARP